MRFAAALMFAALLGAPMPAPAQQAAEEGDQIIRQWCHECHAGGGNVRGTDAAPTLENIAKRRSADYVRGFLANPHTTMPKIDLTTKEIDAVVAYLDRLKQELEKTEKK